MAGGGASASPEAGVQSFGFLQPGPSAAAGAGPGSDGAIATLLQQCLTAAPLRAACDAGDLPRVRQEVQGLGAHSKGARSALQGAVSKGQAAVVEALLDEGVPLEPAPVPANGTGGTTAAAEAAPYVVQAAAAGSAETLRLLVASGASLLDRGHAASLERGHGARAAHAALVTTALGAAAWAMQLEALETVAELLAGVLEAPSSAGLDAPAEVRAPAAPERGRAAPTRLQEFVWAQGATPLLLALHAAGRAADSNGDAFAEAAASVLLRRKADPDARNAAGETALHVAARNGLSCTITTLLHNGADPSVRNVQGDTAESIALRAGRANCVEALRNASPLAVLCSQELTALEAEEANERARQDRARERHREKKLRQRERLRALRAGDEGAEGGGDGAEDAEEEEVQDAAPVAERQRLLAGAATRVDSRATVETLRERAAQALRERAKLQKQLRHTLRRRDEEAARADQVLSRLAEVQGRVAELKGDVEELEAKAEAVEAKEKVWREVVEKAGEERAALQAVSHREADEHSLELARLCAELTGLSQPSAGEADAISSFEHERSRRLAAEEQCRELARAIEATVSDLRPFLRTDELPPLFEAGLNGAQLTLLPGNAHVHRRLQANQRQHVEDMQDLVKGLNRQIHEREAELEKELDCILGSGLPKLLEALLREGLVTKVAKKAPDRALAARLRASLLRF